jgi:hypothetical protein
MISDAATQQSADRIIIGWVSKSALRGLKASDDA